jgi:asparagine synthetase A
MLKYLKDTVEQLAQQVRIVEDKIENGYCTLRKVILSQVTRSPRSLLSP